MTAALREIVCWCKCPGKGRTVSLAPGDVLQRGTVMDRCPECDHRHPLTVLEPAPAPAPAPTGRHFHPCKTKACRRPVECRLRDERACTAFLEYAVCWRCRIAGWKAEAAR